MENGYKIERKVPTNATGGCLCGAIRYKIKFPRGHDFIANSAKCFCTACRKQTGSVVLHLHAVPISHFTCTAAVSALGDYSCSPGVHRLFCKLCGSFIAWQQDPTKMRGVHDGELDHIEETRQAHERGRRDITVRPTDRVAESMSIQGCAGDMQMQIDGEVGANGARTLDGANTDFTAASSSSESTSTIAREDDTDTSHSAHSPASPSQPTCIRGCCTSTRELEVEICVGTLDEQFLVGKRDKARNVIPDTGFGRLVAHPEGRALWAESGIPGVTDGVTGQRWKYGTDKGVKMDGPRFEH